MTTTLARPTLDDMTVTQPPAPPQWAPPYVPPRPAPSRRTVMPTVIIGLIATAALILGIVSLATRPAASSIASPSSAPAAPTFTDADRAAARKQVCDTFARVAESISVATSAEDGPEPIATGVNARVSISTGALALSRSLSPATPSDVAKSANNLVDAYSNYLITAFSGEKSINEMDFNAMVNATHALRALCG